MKCSKCERNFPNDDVEGDINNENQCFMCAFADQRTKLILESNENLKQFALKSIKKIEKELMLKEEE